MKRHWPQSNWEMNYSLLMLFTVIFHLSFSSQCCTKATLYLCYIKYCWLDHVRIKDFNKLADSHYFQLLSLFLARCWSLCLPRGGWLRLYWSLMKRAETESRCFLCILIELPPLNRSYVPSDGRVQHTFMLGLKRTLPLSFFRFAP